VRALQTEFNRLLARLRTGWLPAPRARTGSGVREPAARTAPANPPLGGSRGWLVRKVRVLPHYLGDAGLPLERLLADPDLQAVIAAAPQPMARILRPLCRMLNIDDKGVLPPPPKRARAPRRRKAPAPAVAFRAPPAEPERWAMRPEPARPPAPAAAPSDDPSDPLRGLTPEDLAYLDQIHARPELRARMAELPPEVQAVLARSVIARARMRRR
jgi:hypothetical protein